LFFWRQLLKSRLGETLLAWIRSTTDRIQSIWPSSTPKSWHAIVDVGKREAVLLIVLISIPHLPSFYHIASAKIEMRIYFPTTLQPIQELLELDDNQSTMDFSGSLSEAMERLRLGAPANVMSAPEAYHSSQLKRQKLTSI
jgi:hypothetical protein